MRKNKEILGKMMVGSRRTKEKGHTDGRPPSRFKVWWGWKEIHQNQNGPLGKSISSNRSVLPFPLFESPNRIILSKSEWVIVVQSCPTLCDPMDYSLTGSSVHGILQARIPDWVAISFSNSKQKLAVKSHNFHNNLWPNFSN